jgi:hypothetical protein
MEASHATTEPPKAGTEALKTTLLPKPQPATQPEPQPEPEQAAEEPVIEHVEVESKWQHSELFGVEIVPDFDFSKAKTIKAAEDLASKLMAEHPSYDEEIARACRARIDEIRQK